jgi:hypothetical protein
MFDKILWSNFDSIMGDLEAEYLDKGKNFYELTYDQRTDAVKVKTYEYIQEISDENPVSSLFPTGEEEKDKPD